jgi:hypothetical protein
MGDAQYRGAREACQEDSRKSRKPNVLIRLAYPEMHMSLCTAPRLLVSLSNP